MMEIDRAIMLSVEVPKCPDVDTGHLVLLACDTCHTLFTVLITGWPGEGLTIPIYPKATGVYAEGECPSCKAPQSVEVVALSKNIINGNTFFTNELFTYPGVSLCDKTKIKELFDKCDDNLLRAIDMTSLGFFREADLRIFKEADINYINIRKKSG